MKVTKLIWLKKHLDKQYNNDENVHRQQHAVTRKFGSNLDESIRISGSVKLHKGDYTKCCHA